MCKIVKQVQIVIKKQKIKQQFLSVEDLTDDISNDGVEQEKVP